MDENPYRSPREAGYDPPWPLVDTAWLWDRIALVVTALVVFPGLNLLALLFNWLF